MLVELFPIVTIVSLISYEFVYRSAKKEITKASENLSDPDFSVGVLKFNDLAHPGYIDVSRDSGVGSETKGNGSSCDSLDEDQIREVLNHSK